MTELVKILKFAVVSGLGLALDFAIFLSLIAADVTPFWANVASGACAVTFVYFASVRRIFSYSGRFLVGLFLMYLAYQAAGVTLASMAVGYLAANYAAPWLAKIIILPVTFGANYLFMRFLTRRGQASGAPAAARPDDPVQTLPVQPSA